MSNKTRTINKSYVTGYVRKSIKGFVPADEKKIKMPACPDRDRHLDDYCGGVSMSILDTNRHWYDWKPDNAGIEIRGAMAMHVYNKSKWKITRLNFMEQGREVDPGYMLYKTEKALNMNFIPVKSFVEAPNYITNKYNDTTAVLHGYQLFSDKQVYGEFYKRNKYIAKGTVRFRESESERRAWIRWAEMIMKNYAIKILNLFGRNLANYMLITRKRIKQADILTSGKLVKGPTYEGETPTMEEVLNWAPRTSEYFGFCCEALIGSLSLFVIPTEALEAKYGSDVLDGHGIVMKRSLEPVFSNAIWTSLDYTPKDLANILSNSSEEEAIEITEQYFRHKVRTSVIQVAGYDMTKEGDNCFTARVYLRNVMGLSSQAKLGQHELIRLNWTEDAWQYILSKAEKTKTALCNPESYMELPKVSDTYFSAEDRAAIRCGKVYDVMTAFFNRLNSWKQYDGITGVAVPAVMYDKEQDAIVVIKSGNVFAPIKVVKDYDGQEVLLKRSPVLEPSGAANITLKAYDTKINALFTPIDIWARFGGDWDGDIGSVFLAPELKVIEQTERIISKPEKNRKITPPVNKQDFKIKLLSAFIEVRQRQLYHVPMWDSLLTTALVYNCDESNSRKQEIIKVIGQKVQDAVDFKALDPDARSTTMNIQAVLGKLGIYTENITQYIGLGARYARTIGFKPKADYQNLNSEEIAIRNELLNKYRSNKSKALETFDMLIKITTWHKDVINIANEATNPQARELVDALGSGLSLDLKPRIPKLKSEYFGWKWLASLRALYPDEKYKCMLDFIKYLPDTIMETVTDIQRTSTGKMSDWVVPVRQTIRNIVNRGCELGADKVELENHIAWGLCEKAFSRTHRAQYIPPVLLPEAIPFITTLLEDYGFWFQLEEEKKQSEPNPRETALTA